MSIRSHHTIVDPFTAAEMATDNVARIPALKFTTLCTKYRAKFHLPRPRLGQWILDGDGKPHWIAPRAFARSLGFPNTFKRPEDDLIAYGLLGNSIAIPSALQWTIQALQRANRFHSSPDTLLANILHQAIPARFRSPVTGRQILAPAVAPLASHEWIAQQFEITIEIVHLCSSLI